MTIDQALFAIDKLRAEASRVDALDLPASDKLAAAYRMAALHLERFTRT